MKRILIANDDGVHAPGLQALREALADLAEIVVVAPLTEQSASSHALTLHHPLRIQNLEPRVYAVEGTPTDCVLLAVKEILEEKPDLVVSGINKGPNLGEDVLYSGTVAAAMEGALLGIPSVAFSLASWEALDFEPAGRVARRLVGELLRHELPPRFLLNVNVPPLPIGEIRGFQLAQLGSRVYHDIIVRKQDPRGRDYYWIGGSDATWRPSADSDFQAVEDRHVAVTPLLLDFTNPAGFAPLAGLDLEWP
jgi:5'-nucleotidase